VTQSYGTVPALAEARSNRATLLGVRVRVLVWTLTVVASVMTKSYR